MKKIRRKLLTIVIVVAVCFAAFGIYVGDYYHADAAVLEQLQMLEQAEDLSFEAEKQGNPDQNYRVIEQKNRQIAFIPDYASTGIIFYPGGKVQYEAYVPLLERCAENGIMCILVHMPFNLAVFDIAAAKHIVDDYPQIDHWYVAGHSLGGAMAATHVADQPEDYEGLILLAGYSTQDLNETGLRVLSMYGSEDGVMSQDTYQKHHDNLPQNATELEIEGGCHAYFGVYGAQKGDGEPTISNEEQLDIASEAILEFLK